MSGVVELRPVQLRCGGIHTDYLAGQLALLEALVAARGATRLAWAWSGAPQFQPR